MFVICLENCKRSFFYSLEQVQHIYSKCTDIGITEYIIVIIIMHFQLFEELIREEMVACKVRRGDKPKQGWLKEACP